MTAVSDTLDHFFRENRDDLIGFFLRRLHCPDTAKDLAQETFLRLLFSEQRAPTQDRRALAFFIAGNLVVDHIRKESVRAVMRQARMCRPNYWRRSPAMIRTPKNS